MEQHPILKTLPGDDIRQIMWRYSERYDLQMLIQSTRNIARGIVAKLVAQGARNTHEWTQDKQTLMNAFDQSGISTVFIDPEFGGYIEGPKNMAMALVSFELAWVDAGAATCSLATNLALDPIHEKGTYEQNKHYMSGCVPGQREKIFRGAFALTEPLPYVGVDAASLSGKMRVAEWKDGEEPVLEIEKRGRFITNMDFANFITAAVDTDDDRIKTSSMVILEEDDPGLFDKGAPTQKMVHQLSSTCDPIFKLKVPANRIIGGYTVNDGVIIPNFTHGEIIEAVFRRTRVTVGLMSAAKLLSAVEPVIRYHRCRFRGGGASRPDTPRFEQGVQQKEDAIQRLVDVWATGEASASLGFAAARFFDEYDHVEKASDKILKEQGIKGARAKIKAFRKMKTSVLEYIRLSYLPPNKRDKARFHELDANPVIKFQSKDPLAMVLCPASKLWNTGWGANMMREAVAMMGGYGITEDCPGFLMHKWIDMQLEATYEGPEVVQRRQLSLSMNNELFLEHVNSWLIMISSMIQAHPNMGLEPLSESFKLWRWTLEFLQKNNDANGNRLYQNNRQGVTFPLADAISWLLASWYQIQDVIELKQKGPESPGLQEGLAGFIAFFTDMCFVQAARAAGEVSRICSELVFGYLKTKPENLVDFQRLQNILEESLLGARLAKDRAGVSLSQVMIPEALDYPAL